MKLPPAVVAASASLLLLAPPHASSQPNGRTPCLRRRQCAARARELELGDVRAGNWPTKGCFSKNGRAFFSLGSVERMSSANVPGVQKRIWCVREGSGGGGGGAEVEEEEEAEVEVEVEEEEEAQEGEELVFPDAANAKTYDAVVVGAGWAGIRAIETLQKRGIEHAIVLEAKPYVGGRCLSVNSDGTTNNPRLGANVIPYDLGAQLNYDSGINDQQNVLWEEGYIPDVVWENDNHVDSPPWDGWSNFYQEQEIDGNMVTEKITNGLGQGLDGDDMLERIWWTFVEWRAENIDDLTGKSFGWAIDEFIKEARLTNDEALDFLDLLRDATHIGFGTDDTKLDISEAMEDSGFHERANYMSVPGVGWGNVAAAYAEQFASRIRTNAVVKEIDTRDDGHVVVKFVENGTPVTIKARTVLVTVSIGVLQEGNINFVPALPQRRQRAIDNMGWGVINKVLMSWNDPADMVWPNDRVWILLATEDKETSGRWTTFSNPSKYKGMPSLTAWIGGDDAVAEEMRTDKRILRNVMDSLRKMFPTISEPDEFYVTRWGQDEHVLGAYTFPSPGMDFYDDMDVIGERMGRVYWAGEAYSSNGWATTFGAWDTGEEQAKKMVRALAN